MNKKEKNMKSGKMLVVYFLTLVSVFALSACGTEETPTPAVSSLPAVVQDSSASAVAEGRIVPRDSASLFFMSGGEIEEIMVKEGDFVAKGDILARLGGSETLEANAAAALAEVTSAQQALDDLNRTASLAYNQAVLDEIAAEKAYFDALLAWDNFDQDQYENDLDDAQADVAEAKSDLEDAQDEYDKYASLDKENADRKRAKTDLDAAQADYDEALAAQAAIESEYRTLKSTLDFAEANLDEARRTRANREEGADKDQLALAQARLDSANARLKAAQSALDNLEIAAPYDGIVARMDVSAGEMVNPGQVVLVVADLSEWFVETTDLTENEIVNIQEDMEVVIIPDALPDLELRGAVDSIADYFVEKSGDITYRVRVRLLETDPRLKWGMTTETRFSESSE
jgi:multidrug resistance efflux pump